MRLLIQEGLLKGIALFDPRETTSQRMQIRP